MNSQRIKCAVCAAALAGQAVPLSEIAAHIFEPHAATHAVFPHQPHLPEAFPESTGLNRSMAGMTASATASTVSGPLNNFRL